MSATVWTARETPQRSASAAPLRGRVAGRRAAARAARRLGRVAGACRFAVSTGVWSVGWLAAWVLVPVVALGWTPVAITSGSMAPLIRAGDVVVLDPDADLAPGAVVTVPRGDGRVTHRLVAERGDGTWTTRGDANASADREPVHPEDVLGVGRLVVPLLGAPAATLTGVRTTSAAYTGDAAAAGNRFASGTLAAPAQVLATCQSEGASVLVTWDAVPDALEYQIWRRRYDEGSASLLATVGPNATTFTDASSPFGDPSVVDVGTTRTNRYHVVARRGGWSATSAGDDTSLVLTGLLGISLTRTCSS